MPYDAGFLAATEHGSVESARVVLPPLIQRFGIRTAVDVGCGRGAWVSVLLEHGVDAIGIDGDYIDPDDLLIPKDRFVTRDLSQLGSGYTDGADSRGRMVLFSAAIPDQWGEHHVNERPQSYWIEQVARYELVALLLRNVLRQLPQSARQAARVRAARLRNRLHGLAY